MVFFIQRTDYDWFFYTKTSAFDNHNHNREALQLSQEVQSSKCPIFYFLLSVRERKNKPFDQLAMEITASFDEQ